MSRFSKRISRCACADIARASRHRGGWVVALCIASAWLAASGWVGAQTTSPNSSASAVAATDALIDAQLVATIDGELVFDSRANRIGVVNDRPDKWQTTLVAPQMSASATSSTGAKRLVVRSGESFVISTQWDADNWEIDGTVSALSDAAWTVALTAKHRGFVIATQHQTVRDRAGVFLHAVDPHFPSRVIEVSLNLAPAANPLAADVATLDRPPTELMSYRRMFPPHYPREAMRDGINGKVVLKMLIDEHGLPASAEVRSVTPDAAGVLADAALAAALRWRFNPAMKQGQPQAGYALVPVVFQGAVPTRIALVVDGSGHTQVQEPQPPQAHAIGYRKLQPPVYPEDAVARKITGTVLVNVAVDANGAVRDAFVERAYPADALALSAEALAAVREWRFRVSAVASGDTRRALVPIEFRLESDAFATPGEAETSTPPLDNGDAPLLEKIIVMAQAK